MKKSKLSLGLVTGLIGVMAMSACSSVTSKDGAVVTFKGYDGQSSYTIVTDEMYDEYRNAVDGISKFYEQILEVLIRDAFIKNSVDTEKTLGTIEKEAWDDVLDQKEAAKESADSKGTSYNTEWEAILDSNGVEDTDELYQLFIYQKEKEQIEDWYYEENLETLRQEYLGISSTGVAVEPQADYNGKISSRLPYHLRHILVSIDSTNPSYNRDTITAEQATKLYNVVSKLRDGSLTFGAIAASNSADSSSSSYGDVGIVTNKASSDGSLTMVDEFQLGVYAYDAIATKVTATKNDAISEGLGITGSFTSLSNQTTSTISEAYDDITGSLAKVPYEVFTALNDYKDMENVDGQVLFDGDSMIYPRNVLWNKYLNRHNVFVITNNTRDYSAVPNRADDPDAVGPADYSLLLTSPTLKRTGFRKVSDIVSLQDSSLASSDPDLGVLTDEEGRVIVGVRSQYGVHFMVIQKSIYEFAESASNVDYVDLEDYYTTAVPSDQDYPSNIDGSPKSTYVNFLNTDKAGYNARANEVKEAIKGFDSTYDYRLYEYLYEANIDSLEFSENLDTKIINYLEKQRENNEESQTLGLNRAWESYLELLEAQSEARSNQSRMVPEGCIIAFTDGITNDYYVNGGTCYYGNK
ncbi:MAG: hypothetical protein PHW23_02595 [Bacilli bacterium]|nr:hypothetical protein [Bacilli bacterium]